MVDRDWAHKANAVLKKREEDTEKFDIELIKKRQQQKLIQYEALAQ